MKTDTCILCSQRQTQFPESVVSHYDGETIDLLKTDTVIYVLYLAFSRKMHHV